LALLQNVGTLAKTRNTTLQGRGTSPAVRAYGLKREPLARKTEAAQQKKGGQCQGGAKRKQRPPAYWPEHPCANSFKKGGRPLSEKTGERTSTREKENLHQEKKKPGPQLRSKDLRLPKWVV